MMAALRRSVTCSLPVVVVLGSTGAGKSKLAIQIAKRFNGEIISADSMQVYQGLDIVTNKVTAEEQAECRHHLLDYVSPLHSHYTVTDFQRAALPIITGLLEQKKLPVVVGGTNYYIESLLWNYLLTETQNDGPSESKQCKLEHTEPLPTSKSPVQDQLHCSESTTCVDSGNKVPRITHLNVESAEHCGITTSEILSEEKCEENEHAISESHVSETIENDTNATCASSKEELGQGKKLCEGTDTNSLHSRLMSVDPESGLRIHPKDRRKIIRALEVYDQQGVTRSDLYRQQHGAQGSQALSGPLRYPNICVLWIQCQQSVLDARLDGRVDDMMARGLIRELEEFHRSYHSLRHSTGTTPCSEIDYTLGIFQNIGFKEFHHYLILPEEEKSSVKGRKLLAEGVEKLKQVTRKYSRKQTRWITNRFLKRPGTAVCPVYGLDGTDITRWEESVETPAMEIVSDVIQGRIPALEPLPLEPESKNLLEHNVCRICDKVFITQKEYTVHMSSRKHRRAVDKKRKQDLGLTYLKRLSADETAKRDDAQGAAADVT